jgi:hypothetical protein
MSIYNRRAHFLSYTASFMHQSLRDHYSRLIDVTLAISSSVHGGGSLLARF